MSLNIIPCHRYLRDEREREREREEKVKRKIGGDKVVSDECKTTNSTVEKHEKKKIYIFSYDKAPKTEDV